MSNRSKGDKLETKVFNTIRGIKRTANSGAMFDDADLKDENFIFECKLRTKASISISSDLLKKVEAQSLKWRRDWVIVNRTSHDDYVTMPYSAFLMIYNAYKDMCEKS